MKLDADQLERVAGFFRAFSESTRLALLQELKSAPRSVNELVSELTTSQANISKQLKILHDAGLVARKKEGTKVIYSIDEPAVLELCQIACGSLNQQARPKKLRF